MRGYDKIPALHISMTLNPKLKALVQSFMKLDLSKLDASHSKIAKILYEWAGVSNIPEDERAEAGVVNIEARKVAFIEQMTGQEFRQLGVISRSTCVSRRAKNNSNFLAR